MESERWRLFVGLALPDAHHQAVTAARQALRAESAAVRWVNPANFHITLHFLGDVEPARAPELAGALGAALAGPSAPVLILGSLGAFPDLRRPGVVWAGVDEAAPGRSGQLAALHELAMDCGELIGVEREARPYHPHITLGYVHRDAKPRERAACGELVRGWPALESQPLAYGAASLFRSIQRPAGSEYVPLASWTLAAPAHST